MFGSCSYTLSYRPLTSPPLSRIRVQSLPARSSPLTHSIRSFDSQSRSSIRKWKISCFRQEEISSENLKQDVVEDIIAKELVRPKFEQATVVNKSWATNVGEISTLIWQSKAVRRYGL